MDKGFCMDVFDAGDRMLIKLRRVEYKLVGKKKDCFDREFRTAKAEEVFE
jgi:hypothetical protein